MKNDGEKIDRRRFMKSAAGAAAFTGMLSFPHVVTGQSSALAPGDRLNIAFVGVGGKGRTSLIPIAELGHNIIGLCDVDQRRVADASERPDGEIFAKHLDRAAKRGAKWFTDYRTMFEELADELDGVVISIPDHMHFPVALSAVNLGLNVYCEKPLTHTVQEARLLAEAARRNNVVTQMGNQGHSNDGVRQAKEWIAAGVIGRVHEAYSWTNRPIWPQGLDRPTHDEFIPVIPKELEWDLWQGVAPRRGYDPAYLPFSWRSWWDYGCGAVGDMACHVMDAAYYCLELGLPESIRAIATSVNDHSAPEASAITYMFPARGDRPALMYHWLDGGLLPPTPSGMTRAEMLGDDHSGTLLIGEDGYLTTDTYTRSIRIFPEARFEEFKRNPPPETIERVPGTHQGDWIRAIVEDSRACSDWDYGAALTEIGLLGNVAIRAGTTIEYDAREMKVTNVPEANRFLMKEYPDGWILS